MDRRVEIREFLMSRRARITPSLAGVPTYGGLRRVPGLRRDEVAQLAGVSTDYYARLERGNTRGVSASVLEAVARALQLDQAERAHLLDLARTASTAVRGPRRVASQRVRPGVQRLLDGLVGVPAFVQNGRLDVLGANALGRALYSDLLGGLGASGIGPDGRFPNHARYTFLDPRAADFYPDWGPVAAITVAMLRAETGRSLDDRVLNDLVGELMTRSQRFAALWAGHDVRLHTTGTKRFRHSIVGDLSLEFETLDLAADAGQTLITYTAKSGSVSEDALSFLASWAPTSQQPLAGADQTSKNTHA